MVEGDPPVSGGGSLLGIGEMPAETVAAVDRTGAGRDEQGAPGILVQHAGYRARSKITHRIGAESGCIEQFTDAGHDLQQQRIGRIAMAHAGDESTRHAHGEPGIGCSQQFLRLRFQSKQAQQLDRIADRLAPKLLPARRLFSAAGQGNL